MRVNILSYEPANGWILYDYACRLKAELEPYVEMVNLSHTQQPGYDVTFHINYVGLREILVPGIHSTLVTHIDTPEKFSLINNHAQSGIVGHCMSEETARRMNALTGTKSFFNFSPPSMIRPPDNYRKKFIVASRLYPDGRKNGDWIVDFFSGFDSNDICVRIMGAGWEPYVSLWCERGYKIEYAPEFDKDLYIKWLEDSDYSVYTGHDEGALSTLDALLYGVVPICTAQGYHLEQKGEMLLFQTREELHEISSRLKLELEERRRNLFRLTDWSGFAKKHLNIWNKALKLSR
jgi:hypothetical protein